MCVCVFVWAAFGVCGCVMCMYECNTHTHTAIRRTTQYTGSGLRALGLGFVLVSRREQS